MLKKKRNVFFFFGDACLYITINSEILIKFVFIFFVITIQNMMIPVLKNAKINDFENIIALFFF